MAMEYAVKLLLVEKSHGIDTYVVSIDGGAVQRLGYEEMLRLIKRTPVGDRNCMIMGIL